MAAKEYRTNHPKYKNPQPRNKSSGDILALSNLSHLNISNQNT